MQLRFPIEFGPLSISLARCRYRWHGVDMIGKVSVGRTPDCSERIRYSRGPLVNSLLENGCVLHRAAFRDIECPSE